MGGAEPKQAEAAAKQTASRGSTSHGLIITSDRSEEQKVADERAAAIADLISLALWRDRATVVHLTERWKVTEREVERLHRVAAARVRASRGSPGAQLEHSVAVLRKIRDDELAFADECNEQAKKANGAKGAAERDLALAKNAKRLAGMARTTALAAQRQIDSITIARPVPLVQVSVLTAQDFTRAWEIVAKVLDTRYPGATADAEAALAAWEDRGDPGLDEYLNGENAVVLAEHNGSFEVQ